ncbi:condensation domain-containing protein, partial [Actinophytocola sp.]|uniref:condensation domain-containing protein n=1 Tax=Actinophytocola sp. TaxID=1872138 RepID=UPI00389A0DB4
GSVLAGELRWWLERLPNPPPELPLPVTAARPPVAGFAGAAVPFTLGGAETGALREIARRHRTTLFTVLLAGCHALLSRVCGVTDVLVGTPTTGRTRPEVAGLVGFFVNTVVMRGDCAGDPDFATLLDRTRDWALAAYAHQDVPFERLVKALVPDRDLSRPPLAQVLVQLEPDDPVPHLTGVRATRLTNVEGGIRADLEIHFHDGPDGVTGEFVYATDLFDADAARPLADALVRVLRRTAAEPSRRLSELDDLVPTGGTR